MQDEEEKMPLSDTDHIAEVDAQESTSKEDSKETGKRIYEVGYLLVPTLSEEEVPASYGNLKDLVSSMKGDVISDEMPKMITLAYQMTKVVKNVRSKYDSAYFGWTKFELNAEVIADFKKKLTDDPNFLRFLIVKTVRTNTVVGRKFGQRYSKKRTYTKKIEEPGEPIDKEEIDKEIEAMVSV